MEREQVKFFNGDGTESLVDTDVAERFMNAQQDDRTPGDHPGYALAMILGSLLIGCSCVVGVVWAVFGSL